MHAGRGRRLGGQLQRAGPGRDRGHPRGGRGRRRPGQGSRRQAGHAYPGLGSVPHSPHAGPGGRAAQGAGGGDFRAPEIRLVANVDAEGTTTRPNGQGSSRRNCAARSGGDSPWRRWSGSAPTTLVEVGPGGVLERSRPPHLPPDRRRWPSPSPTTSTRCSTPLAARASAVADVTGATAPDTWYVEPHQGEHLYMSERVVVSPCFRGFCCPGVTGRAPGTGLLEGTRRRWGQWARSARPAGRAACGGRASATSWAAVRGGSRSPHAVCRTRWWRWFVRRPDDQVPGGTRPAGVAPDHRRGAVTAGQGSARGEEDGEPGARDVATAPDAGTGRPAGPTSTNGPGRSGHRGLPGNRRERAPHGSSPGATASP